MDGILVLYGFFWLDDGGNVGGGGGVDRIVKGKECIIG